MKKPYFIVLLVLALFASCKDDDQRTCITCQSALTSAFELCKESNGNASVNGEDTGVSYNIYMQDLVTDGIECN